MTLCRLDGFDDGLLLGNRARERLLAINIQPAARGFRGHQPVPIVGNRDQHRVQSGRANISR